MEWVSKGAGLCVERKGVNQCMLPQHTNPHFVTGYTVAAIMVMLGSTPAYYPTAAEKMVAILSFITNSVALPCYLIFFHFHNIRSYRICHVMLQSLFSMGMSFVESYLIKPCPPCPCHDSAAALCYQPYPISHIPLLPYPCSCPCRPSDPHPTHIGVLFTRWKWCL